MSFFFPPKKKLRLCTSDAGSPLMACLHFHESCGNGGGGAFLHQEWGLWERLALQTCGAERGLEHGVEGWHCSGISKEESRGSSLFLAQKWHYTHDWTPSLHLIVLSTLILHEWCHEITRKCGKESTRAQWNQHFAGTRWPRLICGGLKTKLLVFSALWRQPCDTYANGPMLSKDK